MFRGLRVRMGINSGIDSPGDCNLNKAAGRMHYTGANDLDAFITGLLGQATGLNLLLLGAEGRVARNNSVFIFFIGPSPWRSLSCLLL